MGKETKLLEKIELVIPGFHGYKKKELIREDDRLVRGRVADILAQARREMERALQRCAMVSCAQLMAIDNLRKKLMMLESRVRHAEAGYRGYFDRVKFKEKELNRLLEYDAKMIELAEEILNEVKALNGEITNPQALGMAVLNLDDKLVNFEEVLNGRMSFAAGE
ncbi:hypothetical protein [Thermococcus thioreducens]|uniref:Uncharacterized protein n=1 Tax=Thermococcus thioreducens TaxID=277988 RepID=A0A0Q2M549_9EURY|nr:hypothetical protein [Thermococcus thioreducens]ASJ12414.1 hypothetical protein A3L14_05685 [Thermococcus thioreducens]KQH83145.1 hypothetical protein AMR53_02690 [Thermococcus thioreducens]SEV91252.1 hypothetical protein SAMN05216170_0818 [Thermococcus thioreducens]